MSEMIERVAKAKWARRQEVAAWAGVELANWDDELEALREEVRAETRCGFEAMREPTPEINSAMRRAFERQEDIWSAGIDAALAGHAALKDQ